MVPRRLLRPFQISVSSGTTLTSTVVTIIDDDPPGMPQPVPPVVVGFDSATYSVNEASGTVELTVSVISGNLTETIRLSYAVSDVSTTVSDDYTVSGDTLELSLMTPSVTISVDITDDMSDEPEEEFTVELSGAPAGITLDPATATVTIIDDDEAPAPSMTSISFVEASSTSDEGTTANVVVELDGDLPGSDVVVSFTVGGTAVAGADFTSPGSSVTIPAGMRSAMITFAITSDSRYEGADDTVVLTLTSATGDVTLGTTSVHTVTIMDAETAPTVRFNTDSSTSDEGTTANVVVELDGDLHGSEVVVSFTVGGTAVAGTDYTSPVTSVTIPAGERSAMITFNIDADQRYEGADETVVLTLTSATGDVTLGATSVHTVTIMDETAPTVRFNTDSSTVDEGTTANVEVELDGDLARI